MEPHSSPHRVEVSVSDPVWNTLLGDAEAWTAQLSRSVLAELLPDRAPVELSVLLTDDEVVRELNATWRGKDVPTNVLSFPSGESDAPEIAGQPRLLGDVVLASGTVVREAAEQARQPADHAAHLLVHGILHLLGHDHDADEQALVMERLETRLLAARGLPDPHDEADHDDAAVTRRVGEPDTAGPADPPSRPGADMEIRS